MSGPKVDVKSFFQDLICFLESRDDLAGFEVKQTEEVSAAVADLIGVATSAKNALAIIASSEEGDTSDKFHQLFFEDLPALRAALARIGGDA